MTVVHVSAAVHAWQRHRHRHRPATPSDAAYRRCGRPPAGPCWLGQLGALVGWAVLLDIATGPAFLPLGDGGPGRARAAAVRCGSVQAIVWTIRLPVALTAITVGAALGLSGALMQTILNNPLASSYTLGISAGAGFGAALGHRGWGPRIAGAGGLPRLPLNAVLFAGIACAGVYLIGGCTRRQCRGPGARRHRAAVPVPGPHLAAADGRLARVPAAGGVLAVRQPAEGHLAETVPSCWPRWCSPARPCWRAMPGA
jgi:ABC-type Fe3+-siderophore transport system permease subunit